MAVRKPPVSRLRIWSGVVGGFVALAVLSGCSHSSGGAGTQNGQEPASSPGAGGGSAKSQVIGLTVQSIANPFFVAIQDGAQAEARKFGGTVTLQDGRQDIGNQANIMDNFVQEHVSFVILNAVDSAGIAPAVQRVRQAGIPVIAVDVGAQGGVNATIASDNVQAGRIAAEYMAKRLHGKGDIAVVDGPPVTAVQDRDKGLKEVLAQNPGLKVVSTQVGDGSRAQALRLGTNILTANPHLDAVFAVNDPTALGVELAAKQASRTDFFIVSIDGSPDVAQDMKAHGMIAATAAQDPVKLGQMAVQVGEQILSGKKLAATNIKLPVKLITQDNVASYAAWKP